MRFVRLLAASAALACAAVSGQAQAAKVFTISGNATGSVQVALPYPFPTGESGSHTINLVTKFDDPFSGFVEFFSEYTYYVTDSPFDDANELDYPNTYADVSNVKSVIFTNQLKSGWKNGVHYTYMPRPAWLIMTPNDEQASFSYTANGFHALPEPATWAMMILGFGAIGATMRKRQLSTALAA